MRIRNLVSLFLVAAAVLAWSQSDTGSSQVLLPNNSAKQVLADPQTSFTSYSERTARTVTRGIDELTQHAETIVRGAILSAVVERHPQFNNLLTVVVTMSVAETMKGAPQRSLIFRQYIWDQRDRLGSAGYLKGEEVILLLGPTSQYGLTSPVGLEQGRFRVLRDAQGNARAVNGRSNVGLFRSVEQRSKAQGIQLPSRTVALVRRREGGSVPLGDLEEAIKTFARTK